MLTLDGLIIDATVIDVLEKVQYGLHELGINKLNIIKDTADNIMVTCPFHKDGQERKPTCGIHKETGVVHCFTCGYTATLPEFISNCLGYDDGGLYGVGWLRRNFQDISIIERPDVEVDCVRHTLPHRQYSYVPDMVLDQYRYIHPYMYKRKLTDKVIEMFDVGYDKDTDCITFPVRIKDGNCLFVARRSVRGKYFNYPAGAEKPLYGVYELSKYASDTKSVIVCESMFNCLTCWAHGNPAIALNGTGSSEQIEQLKDLPVRELILALDPDDAGRHGMERIRKAIKNKILYTVTYRDSRDINDLNGEEYNWLLSTKHIL